MVKTGQVRCRQGLDKLKRSVVAMCNSRQCCFINSILKKDNFVLEQDLAV